MPILSSSYDPSIVFKNPDAATIYSSKLRRIHLPKPVKERLELADGDFLDLEWNQAGKSPGKNAVILLHGLVGTASRSYMKGMAKKFTSEGIDAISMNFRGCSEEVNRKYQSYHAGETNDLSEVIDFIIAKKIYDGLIIIGFSLGGNIVLKYLGEKRIKPKQIVAGIAISVPCDLEGSLKAIKRNRNYIYSKWFQYHIKRQLIARSFHFPQEITKKAIRSCASIRDLDDLYTSKAHGFEDASDYYAKNSSLQFLPQIKIPALILNARDDSFLSDSCYPVDIAKKSSWLFLEMPNYGGHVGFITNSSTYYHEKRAFEFANKYFKNSAE